MDRSFFRKERPPGGARPAGPVRQSKDQRRHLFLAAKMEVDDDDDDDDDNDDDMGLYWDNGIMR